MTHKEIKKFKTIEEFHESVKTEIKEINEKIDMYSKFIGEKIRTEEKNNNEDFKELKEKLESTKNENSKSKKTKSKKSNKKNQKPDWIQYEQVNLYNGISTKGELELYFKSLDEMRSNLQKLENTQKTIEKLLSTGIKQDLGCLCMAKEDGVYDMAFVNLPKREPFTYQSVITVGCEQ